MQSTKRLIAVLLALLMLFSSACIFAEEDEGAVSLLEQAEPQPSYPEAAEPPPEEEPVPPAEDSDAELGFALESEDFADTEEDPDPDEEPVLEGMDYWLSLLRLDRYTYKLTAKQLSAKSSGRKHAGRYDKRRSRSRRGREQAIVAVRSEDEARQVAEACLAELVSYNGYGLALLELSDEIPAEILFELTTYEEVPLPALEPNYYMSLCGAAGEGGFSPQSQYGELNTNPLDQYHHRPAFMDTGTAWATTKGAGVTVAVIDTGIDTAHPKFTGRIDPKSARAYKNGTVVSVSGLSNIGDTNGHGTHVAGIIAASQFNTGGNAARCAGVAPEANLLIIKLDDLDYFTVIAAMNYVAGLTDVPIVNMSLGGPHADNLETAVTQLVNSGKLLVAAAGNSSNQTGSSPTGWMPVIYPAAYPEALAVSATTINHMLASYSCIGISGTAIDIAAPGSSIYSTIPNGYGNSSGTSMASPNVAGVAALVKAAFPSYSANQIRQKLISTARKDGNDNNNTYNNATNFGAGLVHASAAVAGANAIVPVSDITYAQETATAGVPLTLTGTVVPANATNKTIAWSVSPLDLDATEPVVSGNVFTAKKPGVAIVRATIANGLAVGTDYTQDFDVLVSDPPTNLITVTPTHAILADTMTPAMFTAALTPDIAENYPKITWSVEPSGVVMPDTETGNTMTVKAVSADPGKEQTVRITATYEGKYFATATVEILPQPATPEVVLLESKVTVNRAKTVGALLPVLITNQEPSDIEMGMSALALPGEPSSAGSLVIEDVKLYAYDSKKRLVADDELPGYEARMYGFDDRYIAIDADTTARNAGSVMVKVKPENGSEISAGIISLTVVEKYPKITLKAGQLNLAFPDQPAPLTATSPAGACQIKDISTVPAGAVKWENDTLKLDGMTGIGNIAATVEVEVAGYKQLPEKNLPKVNVKVINTAPKLKLSVGSLSLLNNEKHADVQLLSGNAKVPFESGYAVKAVEISAVNAKGQPVALPKIDVEYRGDGVIRVTPDNDFESCSSVLKVTFEDSSAEVYLPLKVTKLDHDKLTASVRVKAVTVNTDHRAGDVITIPITMNAANCVLSDWDVVSVNEGTSFYGSDLAEAVWLEPGPNQFTLEVINQDKLKALVDHGEDKKYTLNIHSRSAPKAFAVILTVTAKPASFAVSAKGKIDIANPNSAIVATVKTANFTSVIQAVTLWEDATKLTVHPDFKVTEHTADTFTIMAKRKEVVPKVKNSVFVEVAFANGETMFASKPLTITPAQTVGKAFQSRKSITLYKLTPFTGQAVGLNLTTSAGVKLGAVRIHEPSVKAMKFATDEKGFKVERSGENEWTVYFADGKAPVPKTGNLKPSYALKLELWAKGTYEQDDGGGFIDCLRDSNGNPKSKPTLVSVKVNIK